MHIAFAEMIAVVFLSIFSECVHQIERHSNGFIGMVSTGIGEPENGNYTLAVRSLNVTAGLQ